MLQSSPAAWLTSIEWTVWLGMPTRWCQERDWRITNVYVFMLCAILYVLTHLRTCLSQSYWRILPPNPDLICLFASNLNQAINQLIAAPVNDRFSLMNCSKHWLPSLVLYRSVTGGVSMLSTIYDINPEVICSNCMHTVYGSPVWMEVHFE